VPKTGTPQKIPTGGFVEGGIDLTALGIEGCFASFIAETRSSPSVDAQLKDFVLGQFEHCGSTNVTAPADGAGNLLTDSNDSDTLPEISIEKPPQPSGIGQATVTDSAVLDITGTSTWSGKLDFYLCGPTAFDATATCDTGGTKVGPTHDVNQDSPKPFVSNTATITSAGRYCWRAVFTSETAGVPNSSDSSATECFEVLPVTPSLATTAGPDVDFGQAVTDTATLSGTVTRPGDPIINGPAGAAAGGIIRFTLVNKAACNTILATREVGVNGNGTYGPVSFTPSEPGIYHWKAQYFPDVNDPNNLQSALHNADCSVGDEEVVVRQVQTILSTRQFVLPQDKAKIEASGGGALSGNVEFKLYDSLANCTANGATGLLYSEPGTSHIISGTSPQYARTNNTNVRVDSTQPKVYWRVTYTSSNPAQLGSSSNCTEFTTVSFDGDGDVCLNDNNICLP